MPSSYGRGHHAMLRSVCLSVPFSDSVPFAIDGDMRASPLQTHSIRDSTVGYVHVQMLSLEGWAYQFAVRFHQPGIQGGGSH